MKILNEAQAQQVAGGGDIIIETKAGTFVISDEGISPACAQALPSLVSNNFNVFGLTQSPCTDEEHKLFMERYNKVVLNTLNRERTFQHKNRISFPMVRR